MTLEFRAFAQAQSRELAREDLTRKRKRQENVAVLVWQNTRLSLSNRPEPLNIPFFSIEVDTRSLEKLIKKLCQRKKLHKTSEGY